MPSSSNVTQLAGWLVEHMVLVNSREINLPFPGAPQSNPPSGGHLYENKSRNVHKQTKNNNNMQNIKQFIKSDQTPSCTV